MKAEFKQNKINTVGHSDRTFLVLAESKQGNIVPLLVEARSKSDMAIYAFTASGYKLKANVTLEAFVKNPIIKDVAGTNKVAIKLRTLINSSLTIMQRMKAAEEIGSERYFPESEIDNTVESILIEKMKESSAKKALVLTDENTEKLSNKFIIVYNYEGERIYLNAKKEGDEISLYNDLVKGFEPFKLNVDKLINNEKVIGIYGTNELASKLKSLHSLGNIRLRDISNTIEGDKASCEVKVEIGINELIESKNKLNEKPIKSISKYSSSIKK